MMPGKFQDTGPGGLSAGDYARHYRDLTQRAWAELDLGAVERIAAIIEEAAEHGRQVFVAGNGGSAATASHIATDFNKTAAKAGKPPARCISLSDNVAFITAIGNDLSFDEIFSRQLENLLQPKDVVLLVSGSGNSPNLLRAAQYAREKGALTAAVLGFDGGKLRNAVDVPLVVPSDHYGVIEDVHMGIGHVISFYLKQRQ